MYILWANNKGAIIRGNWIVSLLNKSAKLGVSAFVKKYENAEITKIYKVVNGRVKGQDV